MYVCMLQLCGNEANLMKFLPWLVQQISRTNEVMNWNNGFERNGIEKQGCDACAGVDGDEDELMRKAPCKSTIG